MAQEIVGDLGKQRSGETTECAILPSKGQKKDWIRSQVLRGGREGGLAGIVSMAARVTASHRCWNGEGMSPIRVPGLGTLSTFSPGSSASKGAIFPRSVRRAQHLPLEQKLGSRGRHHPGSSQLLPPAPPRSLPGAGRQC